jgi:integrase
VLELDQEPLTEFFQAIRSPVTKRKYELRLAQFFDYLKLEGKDLKERARVFTARAKKEPEWAQSVVTAFVLEQKDRVEKGEINASTISIYVKPLKLFCDMNDVIVNWKKLNRKLPVGRHCANDRAPSRDEILKLLAYPDRRIDPCLLVMVSSGIRIGAWETLNWGDIEPVEKEGQVLAAKLKAYPGDPEEYLTFISGEAYRSLKEYVDFRQSQGERINAKSPVLRDLFIPDKLGKGEPGQPKRLASNGVKRLLEDALKGTGLRGKLPPGQRRHEWQGAHGFRKFFKTACEKHMKSLHVEMLLGHDTGLNENYYKPSEKELLDDYVKALPDLTIIEKVGVPAAKDIAGLEARVNVLEEAVRQALPLLAEAKKQKKELERLTKLVSKIG